MALVTLGPMPKGVDAFQSSAFGISSQTNRPTIPFYKTTNEESDSTSAQWHHPVTNQKEVDTTSQPLTLTRFMQEAARKHPQQAELESIITSLQHPCKEISHLVRTAALTGHTGLEGDGGSINVQGEEQKKLDVLANEIMKDAFSWTGKIGTIASEEEDEPVPVLDHIDVGPYTAVFDPLDGSSNIDAGIAVGTIFGIFKREDNEKNGERSPLEDTLQPGSQLVAAGYCLYSSATTLVFTTGDGVNGFTLDEKVGEFVLTHPNMRIPERGNTYSFNEANRWDWDQPLQNYISDIQQGLGETETQYTSRYVGSMVADVHRTLLYGGIFGYPADSKNPNGKLRLLYEAAPMSFLVEQAGGVSVTGDNDRIMEIEPEKVHERVPIICK